MNTIDAIINSALKTKEYVDSHIPLKVSELENDKEYTTKEYVDIEVEKKMSSENPVGTGFLSINRKNGSRIGENSVAIGHECEASEQYTFAEGYQSKATSYVAHASGYETVASGNYAHSEGRETTSSGAASHAEGYGTTASGTGSHAEGHDTTASGDQSHAEGYETTASGDHSHAEGYATIASGKNSHSEGNEAIAIGNSSHAEGGVGMVHKTVTITSDISPSGEAIAITSTTAYGTQSHAEGFYTFAGGDNSHAEGIDTVASGEGSHAEGYQTKAIGKGSHAEGSYSRALGAYSHAEGGMVKDTGEPQTVIKTITPEKSNLTEDITINCPTAYGIQSHVEGYFTFASGQNAHAEGNGTIASGQDAHAEGRYALAKGEYSHAEGWNTTASKSGTHAEGYGTIASGQNAHAEGNGTIASGQNAHAEGNGTIASGQDAHAEGYKTTASRRYQHVQGKWNIEDTDVENGYAHIVGNGTKEDARSNAHTLDWDGNAWYQGDVYVGSTSGINKDEGSKKLATEEDVNNCIENNNIKPKNFLTLIDSVNGYEYIITMENGILTSRMKLTSIKVTKLPDKTDYSDTDTFDPTGMIVVAVLPDGSEREITDYTHSQWVEIGSTEFKISYEECGNIYTTTIPITTRTLEQALVDFEYTTNEDETYTITSWKETLNGEPSTKCAIPNSELINL